VGAGAGSFNTLVASNSLSIGRLEYNNYASGQVAKIVAV